MVQLPVGLAEVFGGASNHEYAWEYHHGCLNCYCGPGSNA